MKIEMDRLRKQVSALSLEVDDLKATVKEIRQKVQDVALCRQEAIVTFTINAANKFINSGEAYRSEMFYCRGIGWYLTASATKVNGQPESLSIYLNHNHTEIDATKWVIGTSFSISILNETPGQNGKRKKLLRQAFSHKDKKRGFRKFTAVKKLMNRGFLRNDQLKLQINLHANKICRLPFCQ